MKLNIYCQQTIECAQSWHSRDAEVVYGSESRRQVTALKVLPKHEWSVISEGCIFRMQYYAHYHIVDTRRRILLEHHAISIRPLLVSVQYLFLLLGPCKISLAWNGMNFRRLEVLDDSQSSLCYSRPQLDYLDRKLYPSRVFAILLALNWEELFRCLVRTSFQFEWSKTTKLAWLANRSWSRKWMSEVTAPLSPAHLKMLNGHNTK